MSTWGPRNTTLAQKKVSDLPVVLGGWVDKEGYPGSAQVCDGRMISPFQKGLGHRGQTAQRAPVHNHDLCAPGRGPTESGFWRAEGSGFRM